MKHTIALSADDFFTLLKATIAANPKNNALEVLYGMAIENPNLLTDLFQLKPEKQVDNVFDYLLRKNQYPLISAVLDTPLGFDIIKNKVAAELKKSKQSVIKWDKLEHTGLTYISRLLANRNGNGLTEELDEKIIDIFNKVADILLDSDNLFLVKQLTNIKIQTPKSDPKTYRAIPNEYTYEPLFFQLLPLFENRMSQLDKNGLVEWDIANTAGETVLNKALEYRPNITRFLLDKMRTHSLGAEYITELDVTLNKIGSARQWADIVTGDSVDWDAYPEKYKSVLKKTISSYPNGGDELREALATIFIHLVELPALATPEGQDAISGLYKNPKNKDLQSIYMHSQLQKNLTDSDTKVKKHKI